tara:strand:+ start:12087 stop:12290 length:204 start_codon:yes stop_codon:yes gene_type:complete
MYANRTPFTVDSTKGPKSIVKATKKASKAKVEETISEEPAKIEVIDLITEPAVEPEPVPEEVEDANS